jgi:hypothetical protein
MILFRREKVDQRSGFHRKARVRELSIATRRSTVASIRVRKIDAT